MSWLYILVAVPLAQAAGILQVLYRRGVARLPARFFFSLEGFAFGGSFILVALAVTGDLYFSLAFGLILTTLTIFGTGLTMARKCQKAGSWLARHERRT